MKSMSLRIDDDENLALVAKALSSPVRLSIIRVLNENSYNINEIAERLNLPMSTTAVSVKALEETGLIKTESKPGTRGTIKLCSRKTDVISIDLVSEAVKDRIKAAFIAMPIGAYSECRIGAGCGIVNQNGIIDREDDTKAFYNPARFTAQLLWFAKGYVEYRFPLDVPESARICGIEVSLELCSEAPNYRNDWPSDISFWINGIEIGTWTSPGDFGGRRGKYNPAWWSDTSTQYGLLKKITVDSNGTMIDSAQVSRVTIHDLGLRREEFVALRVGVRENAKNAGGLNLFGEGFGDYQQNINMRIDYI